LIDMIEIDIGFKKRTKLALSNKHKLKQYEVGHATVILS